VERTLLAHSETAPGGARMSAVAFIHRFGAALNPNKHACELKLISSKFQHNNKGKALCLPDFPSCHWLKHPP
jgi:hypothetical protein